MATRKSESDLACYVNYRDVQIVVERIPAEFRQRLRDVFIRPGRRGVRVLGSVRRRGRRDIQLNALLPYRVSLRGFVYKGQSALEFGAPSRGQWPPWAVRRFLLYDVLLHELGHLQVANPNTTKWNRKYASETRAQEFADTWRRKLWTSNFDHPDPVHNLPQADELSLIPLWRGLNKQKRFHLVDIALRAPHARMPDLTAFGGIEDQQRMFLSRALCYDLSGHNRPINTDNKSEHPCLAEDRSNGS